MNDDAAIWTHTCRLCEATVSARCAVPLKASGMAKPTVRPLDRPTTPEEATRNDPHDRDYKRQEDKT